MPKSSSRATIITVNSMTIGTTASSRRTVAAAIINKRKEIITDHERF